MQRSLSRKAKYAEGTNSKNKLSKKQSKNYYKNKNKLNKEQTKTANKRNGVNIKYSIVAEDEIFGVIVIDIIVLLHIYTFQKLKNNR